MFKKDLLIGLLRMEVDSEDSYHRRPLDMSRGGALFKECLLEMEAVIRGNLGR